MTIQPARLIVFCLAASVIPVRVQAQAEHGWVTGNVVAAVPATDRFAQNLAFPYRFENLTGSLGYKIQTQASFDIGAGIALVPHFGVGMALSRWSTSQPAAVTLSVPDALRFNLFAPATGVSVDSLPHTETAIHLEGVYILAVPRGSVRLFAGPSMMRVTQEVITEVEYTEVTTGTSHTVSLTGESHGPSSDTAFGFNVGADGGVYIHRHLGVGAMLRYSRATATIKNVLQSRGDRREVDQDLRIGGLSIGAGLRVRF